MNQSITIVGSSARAAAFSAASAGFCVYAADQFADEDLRRIAHATMAADYPAGLATAIGGPQPGGWIYCGGLENYPRLVDQWAESRPLWGNQGATLRRVRDPHLLSQVLRGAGLPAPDVRKDPRDVPCDGTWLLKSAHSGGGLQVAAWTPDRSARQLDRHAYWQRLIDGTPHAGVFVAARGQARLLGVTRQLIGTPWTGSEGFHYSGSLGPLWDPQLLSGFESIGDVLAKEFELVGLFGVDAIVNADGVWTVEVNPRYTASVEVIERAADISAIGLHVASCAEKRLPESLPNQARRTVGKAIVYATSKVRISERVADWLTQESQTARPTVADIPAHGQDFERGWPILTALVEGDDAEQTLGALKTHVADLQRRLGD